MPNPEISRRCTSCGATIRQRAMFCPQCGNGLELKDKEPFDPTKTIAESRDVRTDTESAPPTALDPSVTQPLRPMKPPTEPLRRSVQPVDEKAQTIALSSGQLPQKKEPVSTVGKVGKLKRVSTAVLDQAAYDPSARFLLIAAGLFVVFVILLLLSRVLG